MNTKKYIRISVILSLFFVSIFASGGFITPVVASTENVNSPSVVKNIAIVFSTGKLGDRSFNDMGFLGAQSVNDTSKVNIDYVEPDTVTDINTFLDQFGASTDPVYDLIIAIGFSSTAGLNASALKYPSRNFALIDSVVALDNVASVLFKEEEGAFLVGAMAAMTSQAGHVAFLGGLKIPLIDRFRSGYEQGARYINPDIILSGTYAPDANNPWGDKAGGKAVANDFIDDGADVIFVAAGGTGEGAMEAAKDAEAVGKTVYAIGVDADQDWIQPGYVLASAIKRVDTAVANLITDTVTDAFAGNTTLSLGIKENGMDISQMFNTTFIRDSVCTTGVTRYEAVTALKAKISDGSISVIDTLLTDAKFTELYNTPHECTEPVPARPSASTPGFELPLLFVGFVAITLVSRRRKN